MAILKKTTKGVLAAKAAKGVAERPALIRAGAQAVAPVARLGVKATKPRVKRKTRRRAKELGDSIRTLGTALATYGPPAAQELGLVEPPKQKRTAPRVAAGMAVGAGAMYLLEPEHGAEHRKKLMSLVA
jgi:hypothetical protein